MQGHGSLYKLSLLYWGLSISDYHNLIFFVRLFCALSDTLSAMLI